MLRSSTVAAAVATAIFSMAAILAPVAPARAEHCSGVLFDGVASRLRALEVEQATTATDLVKRSNELVSLLADPSSALWQGTADACPGDNPTRLQTVARRRALVLWGKMIALGAGDGPIFRAPYHGECSRYDGSSLQLDFIHAWLERLDDGGAGFSRAQMWHALDDDPLYAHAEQLAREHARRLKVSVLPTLNTDDEGWLAANEAVHARFAAALPRGIRCGALYGLWGLEQSGAANAPGQARR